MLGGLVIFLLLVKAYIKAGLAEALARNHRREECYRTLDEAQAILDRSRPISVGEDCVHIRLTKHSLESTQGECSVLLGEPQKGLDHLQTAQRKLDPTMSRRRCSLFMQQAEAYLAANQLDYCIEQALQGLQIARALNSKENINWASEIHTKLQASSWKYEPVVRQLKAAIVSSSHR